MKRPLLLASVLAAVLVFPGFTLAGLTDGLVAYYPFNGSANDESGNANHGTLHGPALCQDRQGRLNSAYCFDGVDDFIEVPSSPSLQSPKTALSVSAWVFAENWYGGWAAVCTKSNDPNAGQYGCVLYQYGGNAFLEVQGAYLVIGSGTAFETGRWYHIAYTWDGATVTLYANGQFAASWSLSRAPLTDDRPLEIGVHTPGATEYLNGKLDEVRIYNRGLSPQEVDELYACPGVVEDCQNSVDDDCDGLTDGADPDCAAGPCTGAAAEASGYAGGQQTALEVRP